ncbi:MAG TPA: winged helix DNA-binding domain-containing protein [Streptosporangiaceae bacterium]
MTADRLSLRELNRATLDRQLLLRRPAMPARQAIEHLGGLQAQAPLAPYVGLWTRLAGFRHQELQALVTERAVVRAHLLRNTVHLLTAGDFLTFRPVFQSVMERALAAHFGRRLTGVDPAELREVASALLAETALTRTELGRRLAQRWPGHDPGSLAYAATHLLQLVQVPPRGIWGSTGPSAWVLAAAWLGPTQAAARPLTPREATEELVLRYLAAFGPASVPDIQAWSGLTRLREVTEGLGDRLRPFTGPDGADLLDLPGAPRPDGESTPAPPRFLPEYDNLLLSFADRSRVIPDHRVVPLPPGNGASAGTLLVDGFWRADWKITRGRDLAVLDIRPFTRLGGSQDAIAAEGRALLEFAAPAASYDVRLR